MAYAMKLAGEWQELTGPFTLGDNQYPANWPDLVTTDELAALGIVQIVEAAAPSPNVQVTGVALVDVAGVPTRQWITQAYPADQALAVVVARINAARDARMNAGCATPKGRMDTNDAEPVRSQRKLNGAVTAAIMATIAGQPFTVDWTMEDNSVVTHSGPEIMAAGAAVTAYIAACQYNGTALKAAATAAADPFSIDITTGWPS